MFKKVTYIFALVFFTVSCADIKRGVTGDKKLSTDEFMIKKKDPLIMPPDYENLPNPDERTTAKEEISEFEKSLGTSIEDDSSTSSSAESSILKQIHSR